MLQGIERRLSGVVGNTFARLFGGSVQPAEVAGALQREAANNLRREGTYTVAPNHYLVHLGPSDHADVGDDATRVEHAFTAMLGDYLDEHGWGTYGDVAVTLVESDVLHTGQFRINALIDPDVGRHESAIDGGIPMTQSQGDPYGHAYDPPADGPHWPSPAQQYEPRQQQPYQPYPPPYQHDPYQQDPYPPQPYQSPPNPSPPYPPQPYQQPHQQPSQQQPYPQAQPAQAPQQYQPYPAQPPAPQPPTAVLSLDDGTGRQYHLQFGSNVLGRGQDAAFRIADSSVSRRHADVYFDGHTAVLHDLGSTNGTTVNGSTVQTWQLADGDVIRLGHSVVVFTLR